MAGPPICEYRVVNWPSNCEATRLAASISSRTESRVASISAAISTITNAALKAATTRFNRVRSLMQAWYQGGAQASPRAGAHKSRREGDQATPPACAAELRPARQAHGGAHENHEPYFMTATIGAG